MSDYLVLTEEDVESLLKTLRQAGIRLQTELGLGHNSVARIYETDDLHVEILEFNDNGRKRFSVTVRGRSAA